MNIRAVIGLGNPGSQFYRTRHNIGFLILDHLAQELGVQWHKKDLMEIATVSINDKLVLLIKPQTSMNHSGNVIPYLSKQGIEPDQILVIHDELELPYGKIKLKHGGSAKGHNGLRSIIDKLGKEFHRLSFGIGRPPEKHMVGEYVLRNFDQEIHAVTNSIHIATEKLLRLF